MMMKRMKLILMKLSSDSNNKLQKLKKLKKSSKKVHLNQVHRIILPLLQPLREPLLMVIISNKKLERLLDHLKCSSLKKKRKRTYLPYIPTKSNKKSNKLVMTRAKVRTKKNWMITLLISSLLSMKEFRERNRSTNVCSKM